MGPKDLLKVLESVRYFSHTLLCSSSVSWHICSAIQLYGRDFHTLTSSIQLSSTDHSVAHSQTVKGAVRDGFGEDVMSELCKFLFFDSCQKRSLWTHKDVDQSLHPALGFVLQAGGAEKFPQELGLESLDPFLRDSEVGPSLTATEEDGSDKRLNTQLELAYSYKADLSYS